MYFTNNIAEHINKLLNSKFQTKYPTFESWKKAIFSVENDINKKTDYIERVNFGSQIILYFLKWNAENKNNKDLLKYEDIKIMNTFIKPDSNIGNCISFSEFYDLDFLNIDDNKDGTIQSDNGEDDILDSLSSSEDDGELNIENDENSISESNDNIPEIKNLFKHISNENDLCYNVQKLINTINLEKIKKI